MIDTAELLKKYYTLTGIFEKSSSGFVPTWNKRFFTFRDKGRYLCYFNEKIKKAEDKPAGVIFIGDINSVTEKGNNMYNFTIQTPQ